MHRDHVAALHFLYTTVQAAGGTAEPREPARETPAGQELAKLALEMPGLSD